MVRHRSAAGHCRIEPRVEIGSKATEPHEWWVAGLNRSQAKVVSHRFEGVGLRPFAPCHLRAVPRTDGGRSISWLRRTRIGGDTWPEKSGDVPLGEAREAYRIEIGPVGGEPVRVTETAVPRFTYTGAMLEADGLTRAFSIRVAQIGEVYGAGKFVALTVPA